MGVKFKVRDLLNVMEWEENVIIYSNNCKFDSISTLAGCALLECPCNVLDSIVCCVYLSVFDKICIVVD